MITQVTLDQLQARLRDNSGVVLVEALPVKYYRDGHLPGARHLPHDEVQQHAREVLPARDAEIIVYCASSTCQNSHVAARQLVELGYTRVAVYPGGKKEWTEAGLPLEKGASSVPA